MHCDRDIFNDALVDELKSSYSRQWILERIS